MTELASPADLLTALVRLRKALDDSPFPLEFAAAPDARAVRQTLIKQLDDYVIPRLIQIDAPLLAVVGGSTGAGKSTLVNTLIGRRVTEPGVLRPTTRSPVLVHNPADAKWFGPDRLLPDLVRTDRLTANRRTLQLVPADEVPEGLAILDAPDVDSVEEENRVLAAQLLSAADLWIFVTSAARYADQVPWEFLKEAEQRSTAVAVVLDRTTRGALREVSSHLARMLTAKGMGDSPLFTVPEADVDDAGLLPRAVVAPIGDWLNRLAADSSARMAVIRKTLNGTIRSITPRMHELADAHAAQADIMLQLRRDAERTYEESLRSVDAALQDGTLMRGEVLARWQEFVGTGELLRSLEEKVGRIRDRLINAARRRPMPAQRMTVAVESGLETLIREHAESAAERAALSWRGLPAGRALLADAPGDIDRASRDFSAKTRRTVRDWQTGVLDLVRREGADRRATARFFAFGVNGLGVALMVVVFVHTAGLTGTEVGIAGGSAVVGQKILEAVFGDQAVRRLAEAARQDLRQRVEVLWRMELQRYHDQLDHTPVPLDAASTLRDLAVEVDEARVIGSPA